MPRDVMRSLEDRIAAGEDKVRAGGKVGRQRQEESPFTATLCEKVAELEVKLNKARAADRSTDEFEAALTTQRQWLTQAGGSADTAPAPAKAQAPQTPRNSRSTGGWPVPSSPPGVTGRR